MSICTIGTKIQIVKKSMSKAAELLSRLNGLGCRDCQIHPNMVDLFAAMEIRKPDLVFMDICLPGEPDALEVAEIIRKQWEIPVIFDTTPEDQERMKRAEKIYPFRYITGPYDEKDIKISMEIALYASEADRKRRKAEARLARINRLLLAMHAIGQLIITENDPKRLIEAVCSNIANQLDYYHALIILCDDFGRPPIIATASNPPGHFDRIEERLAQGHYPGCIDLVAAQEKGGLILVPEKDCNDCPYGQTEDERRVIAHRLVLKDRVYGNFLVSVPLEHALDEEEQRLFSELADDLAFALNKIEVSKALARQTERVNAAMRLGDMAWWEMQVSSGRITCDEGMIRMMDRDPDEYRGAHYSVYIDLLHPKDREPSLKAVQAILAGHISVLQMDYRISKKDGSYIWVHNYGGVAERYDNGQPKRISGIVLNISKRKKTEEALMESEAFANSVIDNSPDCIKVVDTDGRLKYMSSGGQVLFEIDDVNSFIGLKYIDLWNASPQAPMVERALKEAQAGVSGRVEAFLETSKGTPKWWNITFTPIKTQSDRGDVLVVSRDITDTKTVELQLQAAKEAAEAASLAKSHFLASMSHEIRTPMNAVIGFTELTMHEIKDPVLKEYLSLAYNSAQHLLAIINDILDISKIESGQNLLEKSIFDLQEQFNEVLIIQKKRAEEKGLTLRYEMSGRDFGLLEGDIGRLRQVLLNLVNNAVKFTDTGEIQVNVFLQAADGHQVKLDVMVTDTGIGIPKEKTQMVFEPFSQVETSINRKYGGTGLGLAISRQLVEMMGGALWLESHLGKGSTFGFTVPLNISSSTQLEALPTELPIDDPAERPEMTGPRLNVLLVEDNQVNQKLMVSLLSKKGYQVTVAGDGNEALKILERQSFDLVLMDVQMPELDGLSATKVIREREKQTGAHIPVIALTAHAMKGDRETFIMAGMDDYIPKPIHREEMESIIARVMSQQESA